MTETRRHRRILLEDDGYVPPPSIFGNGGFAAFDSRSAASAPDPAPDPEPASAPAHVPDPEPEQEGLSVRELLEHIDPEPEELPDRTASLDDDEPLWTPQAPPEDRPSFNDVLLGRSSGDPGSDGDAGPLPQQDSIGHDRLATASLAVSLSGFVTLIGFPAGVLMGHMALRRIGPAGWYHGTVKAERRARNAVMIGYLGLAVLAAVALLLAAAWLLQTPLETTAPGTGAVHSTSTTTGGTP